jgi:hypothetical protein
MRLMYLQACAFAASNQGRFVADVFTQAVSEHQDEIGYHRLVLKRIKGLVNHVPYITNLQADIE